MSGRKWSFSQHAPGALGQGRTWYLNSNPLWDCIITPTGTISPKIMSEGKIKSGVRSWGSSWKTSFATADKRETETSKLHQNYGNVRGSNPAANSDYTPRHVPALHDQKNLLSAARSVLFTSVMPYLSELALDMTAVKVSTGFWLGVTWKQARQNKQELMLL